ncbi:hypothetical protein BV25DRAFT_1991137 [Artomyces pyxidatus]|uniref:Uncharacterized protein n=1 Tax=Artomyces pyxidatus TaxID=48021 RepID=A0ACB8T4N1_9AGAM|nr:hypothetical protein BV25DRAFT_1991137 [Artomyces pyxidatus]
MASTPQPDLAAAPTPAPDTQPVPDAPHIDINLEDDDDDADYTDEDEGEEEEEDEDKDFEEDLTPFEAQVQRLIAVAQASDATAANPWLWTWPVASSTPPGDTEIALDDEPVLTERPADASHIACRLCWLVGAPFTVWANTNGAADAVRKHVEADHPDEHQEFLEAEAEADEDEEEEGGGREGGREDRWAGGPLHERDGWSR